MVQFPRERSRGERPGRAARGTPGLGRGEERAERGGGERHAVHSRQGQPEPITSLDRRTASLKLGKERNAHLHGCASSRQLGMTPNQLRLILADALDGAADRLRAGIVPNEEPERTTDDALAGDPLPNVTQHVLRAEDVAQLLGLSRWKVYEAIRLGEIPSIRVGRRLLVPTHALRTWLSESGSGHLSR